MAILLGAVTGAGGGTVRDLMLSVVPAVLRVEIYAVAALSAGTVMVIAGRLGCPPILGAVSGGVVCFVLRVTGFKLGWSLPHLESTGEARRRSPRGLPFSSAGASRGRQVFVPGDAGDGAPCSSRLSPSITCRCSNTTSLRSATWRSRCVYRISRSMSRFSMAQKGP